MSRPPQEWQFTLASPGRRIFLSNLPYESDESDLALWLQSLGYRAVAINAFHDRDGRFMGRSGVEFSTEQDAELCLDVLRSGCVFRGRKIFADWWSGRDRTHWRQVDWSEEPAPKEKEP